MAPRRNTLVDPSIGRRIFEARTRAGISQRQLCAGTDYTAAYISRIEGGDRTPQVRAIRVWAARLGVSAAWLETGQQVVDVRLSCVQAAALLEQAEQAEQPELVQALMVALGVRDERAEVLGLA